MYQLTFLLLSQAWLMLGIATGHNTLTQAFVWFIAAIATAFIGYQNDAARVASLKEHLETLKKELDKIDK